MATPDQDTALHDLIRYAVPLGFCEKTVLVVYETVVAELRRQLLAAAQTIL